MAGTDPAGLTPGMQFALLQSRTAAEIAANIAGNPDSRDGRPITEAPRTSTTPGMLAADTAPRDALEEPEAPPARGPGSVASLSGMRPPVAVGVAISAPFPLGNADGLATEATSPRGYATNYPAGGTARPVADPIAAQATRTVLLAAAPVAAPPASAAADQDDTIPEDIRERGPSDRSASLPLTGSSPPRTPDGATTVDDAREEDGRSDGGPDLEDGQSGGVGSTARDPVSPRWRGMQGPRDAAGPGSPGERSTPTGPSRKGRTQERVQGQNLPRENLPHENLPREASARDPHAPIPAERRDGGAHDAAAGATASTAMAVTERTSSPTVDWTTLAAGIGLAIDPPPGQVERAGIVASFILNAAMIPGWPPPRPFAPPPADAFRGLTQGAVPPSQADLAARLDAAAARRGGAHALARLLRRLTARPSARRSRLLLGLAILLVAVEDVITLLDGEASRLSDRVGGAKEDETGSEETRRTLTA